MYTNENLETLNENLEGTQWSNARLEDGEIFADFAGEINYPIGGGRYQPYSGVTKCRLVPSRVLLEKVVNYGYDQDAFVQQQLDYEPVPSPCNGQF